MSSAEIVNQLRTDYTEHYQDNLSDSPQESLIDLSGRVVHAIEARFAGNSRILVLDLGSGRQALLNELVTRLSPSQQAKTHYVSLDLAELAPPQLVRADSHLIADGSLLPIDSDQVDVVMANLSADFMPRPVFIEIWRVLKKGGIVELNLHHPDLIRMAEERQRLIAPKLAQLSKQLSRYPHSSKATKRKSKVSELEREMNDVRFILKHFKELIFFSEQAVSEFMRTVFPHREVRVSTKTSEVTTSNSWFAVSIGPMPTPHLPDRRS